MSASIETGSFASFDHTQIAYARAGGGSGTPIVIVNGPGAEIHSWSGLIAEFGARHPIITWDYRGFFGSQTPADLVSLGPEGHARDLDALLDHLGIGRAVFLSWSLGTQVALEFYRRRPNAFAGLISVNGTFGHPFRISRSAGALSTLGMLRAVLPGREELLRSMVNTVEQHPEILDYAKRLRLVSPALPKARFLELAGAFASLNSATYNELLRRFAAHDAEEVLRRIRCPALFFAGRRDPLVPAIFSIYMAAQTRNAELCIIPIGSHYVPIEFAEYLNLRIEAFLGERVGEEPTTLLRPSTHTAAWEIP